MTGMNRFGNRIHTFINSSDGILSITLFLIALFPRLWWALADHPPLFSDMEDYYISAIRFLQGEPLSMSPDRLAYRSPGYPLFLALIIKTFFINHLDTVRIVQAFLGSCTVVLLYYLSQVLLSKIEFHNFTKVHLIKTYLLPACIALSFSFMADQIFMTAVFLTEVLDIFVLVLWVYIGLRIHEKSSPWLLILFSLLLGYQALIRPISLVFLPILFWKAYQAYHWNWHPSWVVTSLFAWLLLIIPWTIRNFLLLNAFVFISSNSGVNFFLGHNPTFHYYASPLKEEVRQFYRSQYGANEVGEDRYLFQLGLQYILDHPQELIPRSLAKLYFLYILEVPPWPWEEYNGGQGLILPNWFPLWHWQWELLFLVSFGIIYSLFKKMPHEMLLSVILLYTLACVIYFARTRFRMPIEPFLLIYAWLGVLSLAEFFVWGYRKILRVNQSSSP